MKQYVSKFVVSFISSSLQYIELHKSECNSCFNRLKQFLKSKVGSVILLPSQNGRHFIFKSIISPFVGLVGKNQNIYVLRDQIDFLVAVVLDATVIYDSRR